jgi:hydrogenase expression/formation protein HypD
MNPNPLQFRDPERGAALLRRLERAVERAVARLGGPVSVMHVCGSHEQAIARYGLRARLPAGLDLRMGPGCPVCVTDAPEIDAAVALARSGLPVLTYGDMLRVPGTEMSLEDARAAGARVEVLYAATQAVEIARATPGPVVFFATGFETTAVTTAALLLAAPPPPENLFVLSAHKWVPAAMEIVASDRRSRIAGYLAAGHAATITGFGLFEPFVARHGKPVVVAGFEPLDILAGLALLVEQIADGVARVENAFPRCVSRDRQRSARSRRCTASSTRTSASGAALPACRTATCACVRRSPTATPPSGSPTGSPPPPPPPPAPMPTIASAARSCPGRPIRRTAPSSVGRAGRHPRRRVHGQHRGRVPHLAGAWPVTDRPPFADTHVRLAHGAGGPAMRALIDAVFLGQTRDPAALARADAACLPFGDGFLVITTDAHVVSPPEFPGATSAGCRSAASSTISPWPGPATSRR